MSDGGGGMTPEEYTRLARCEFQIGDAIYDQTCRWASGFITAEGWLGNKRNGQEVYVTTSPFGQMVIPVVDARPMGIA